MKVSKNSKATQKKGAVKTARKMYKPKNNVPKYEEGGSVKVKYSEGGKMTNTEDTYTSRIEALKAKIREEKDPAEKAEMMEELKRLRLLSKKDRANVQSDTFKEKRAKKADATGDKGRGIRIRSSKNTQGVGEVGK